MSEIVWWRVVVVGSVIFAWLEKYGKDWTYRHVLMSYLQPTLKSIVRYLFTTFVKDQYFCDEIVKMGCSEDEWHNDETKILNNFCQLSTNVSVGKDCALILELLFQHKKGFLTERMDTIVLMSKASTPLIILECKKVESCARSIAVDIQQWQWSMWKLRTPYFLLVSVVSALILEGVIEFFAS